MSFAQVGWPVRGRNTADRRRRHRHRGADRARREVTATIALIEVKVGLMGPPLSPAIMRQMLTEAWQLYREHEEHGDDMAAAGAELAETVMNIAAGPTCGLPRAEFLGDVERTDPNLDIPDSENPDDFGYSEYR